MSAIEVIYICPACNTHHAGVLCNPRPDDRGTAWDVRPIMDCPVCGLKPEQAMSDFEYEDDMDEEGW